ncbi:MAG: restriction endonuclease subunit S, partial [SAR324 cluster bacterium]|nr:restriction endonuclease subunit S [SAR324 cluster bacterium]
MAHISKVRLKDIKEAQRFDSEYLLVSLQTFPLDGAKLLSEISDITDGEHGAPELDSKSGIIYLSGHNIKDNVLNIEGIRTCTKRLHDKNKRSSLKKDSVLLSSVGTVGNASVVYTNIIGNTDRHVITIKNINKKFSPYYISTFLNSRIGRMQTNALSCGNVQKMLNLHSARKIRIPIFPQSFQQEIETIVKTAHHKREQSKLLYKQAEKILLEELDMVNYKPKHQLSFTTSKKKIDNARRFDSEYFHPKYDKIIKKIENYYGGWGYV